MIDEGQTGGEEMYVISKDEYEELQFAKNIIRYGIPIALISWVLLMEYGEKIF